MKVETVVDHLEGEVSGVYLTRQLYISQPLKQYVFFNGSSDPLAVLPG